MHHHLKKRALSPGLIPHHLQHHTGQSRESQERAVGRLQLLEVLGEEMARAGVSVTGPPRMPIRLAGCADSFLFHRMTYPEEVSEQLELDGSLHALELEHRKVRPPGPLSVLPMG